MPGHLTPSTPPGAPRVHGTHRDDLSIDSDRRSLQDPADEPDDGFDGGFDGGFDDGFDRLRREPDGERPSSLRYWMTWGIPIAVLVLLGVYLLLPRTGLPTWREVLTDHLQATAPSAPTPSEPAAPALSTSPQSDGQTQESSGSPTAPPSPVTVADPDVDPPAIGRGDLPPSPMPTSPDASTIPTPPADVLAGPVDDGVLQQLLTQSMPERLAASDPAAAASPAAESAVQVAWQALSNDLNAGGWSGAHMQAHEMVSHDTAARPGQLPPETTVVIMWSATSSAGDLQDRQLSAVRMDTGTIPATPHEITTL